MRTGSLHARPSCRRIALLVALGVTIGVAFTAPGRFAARPWLKPLPSGVDIRFPRFPEVVRLYEPDCRYGALYRAVRDLDAGDDAAASEALAPTPQRVAERLMGIDGWSTAVLFEPGSSAGSLRDAGLEDTTLCVVLAGRPSGCFRPGALDHSTRSPFRSWWLVLLDDRGRDVGMTVLRAARPGSVDGTRGVCVYHRTDSGEVLSG